MVEVGENRHKPVIELFHSSLEKFSDESEYRLNCPTCDEGILLVRRHPTEYYLLRYDNCILCGQRFKYLDDKINGETLNDA